MTHDADDEVTAFETTFRRGDLDLGERFVPDHKTLAARHRPAILTTEDLAICAADTNSESSCQHEAIADHWLWHFE